MSSNPLCRSRLAPTPSGFLHLGNAFNFVLCWLSVQKEEGVLRLRIDDLDVARMKKEFVEDIFQTLHWLGISWREGPKDSDEHFKLFSQQEKLSSYNQLIDELISAGKVFACLCSRKEIQNKGACLCNSKYIPLQSPGASLRLNIEENCIVKINDLYGLTQEMNIYNRKHHPVIRRSDGLPSSALASLCDDLQDKTTLIVRGADLLEVSALQIHMATLLGKKEFNKINFYHHPLILDDQGHKLSKSAGSVSVKSWRETEKKPENFYLMVSKWLKLQHEVSSAEDLLKLCKAGEIIFPKMKDDLLLNE